MGVGFWFWFWSRRWQRCRQGQDAQRRAEDPELLPQPLPQAVKGSRVRRRRWPELLDPCRQAAEISTHYVSDMDSRCQCSCSGRMPIPACIMSHSTLIFDRMALLRLMGLFISYFVSLVHVFELSSTPASRRVKGSSGRRPASHPRPLSTPSFYEKWSRGAMSENSRLLCWKRVLVSNQGIPSHCYLGKPL